MGNTPSAPPPPPPRATDEERISSLNPPSQPQPPSTNNNTGVEVQLDNNSEIFDIEGLFLQLSPDEKSRIYEELSSVPSLERSLMNQDNILEVKAACSIDENDSDSLINLISAFDVNHIKRLLQIFQNRMRIISIPLESSNDEETNNQFKLDVKTLLKNLYGFEKEFYPGNWINPVNAPDPYPQGTEDGGGGWNDPENPLSILIRTICPGTNGDPPRFQTYRAFVDAPLSDKKQEKMYKGIDYKTLFAAALAYDIDPYDPLPDINIATYDKIEYFAIVTEILNIAIAILIVKYITKHVLNPFLHNDAKELVKELNTDTPNIINEMASTQGGLYLLSDSIKSYFKSNNPQVHNLNIDAVKCGEGNATMTYNAFIEQYNNILKDIGPQPEAFPLKGLFNLESDIVNFVPCGTRFILNRINELKKLDNPSNLSAEMIQSYINDRRDDHGETIFKPNHPNVYLFVENLLNLILSLEFYLKLPPYDTIDLSGNLDIKQSCRNNDILRFGPGDNVMIGDGSARHFIGNILLQSSNVNPDLNQLYP